MLRQGKPMEYVQAQLGHAKIGTNGFRVGELGFFDASGKVARSRFVK